MKKFIVSQERGSQKPQVKNGASPKSQTSRNNPLTSEKGSDTKQFFMKKAVFAVMIITIAAGAIFLTCKKDALQGKSASMKHLKNMYTPEVDYDRIRKENGMLKFESWEHYVSVIEALQDACVTYSQEHIQGIIDGLGGGEDEDVINNKLDEENFSQFVPVHLFCDKLDFQSLYKTLEVEQEAWRKQPDAPIETEPFIAIGMGRYQSALHNVEGKVMIQDDVYDIAYFNAIESTTQKKANCRNTSKRNSTIGNVSAKKYLYAFCSTNQSLTRAINNPYKLNNKGRRSDWWTSHEIQLYGEKYNKCEGVHPQKINKLGSRTWIGYMEMWHLQTTLPAHLHPTDYARFKSYHKVEGLSGLTFNM
jgi:hypothetical protein